MRELRHKFEVHCSKLGVNGVLHTSALQDGSSHVEKLGDTFHWIVTDRGSEIERRTTNSREEVEYWLVRGVVFALSIERVLKIRAAGQDFRRLMYEKRIEIMKSISRKWGDRIEKEIENLLIEYPYDDGN